MMDEGPTRSLATDHEWSRAVYEAKSENILFWWRGAHTRKRSRRNFEMSAVICIIAIHGIKLPHTNMDDKVAI